MHTWVKVDVVENLVKRVKMQGGKTGKTTSIEGYVDAAIREKLEKGENTGRCPSCGSAAVIPIGSADDRECQSCGWLASDGPDGEGFDWKAWDNAKDESESEVESGRVQEAPDESVGRYD